MITELRRKFGVAAQLAPMPLVEALYGHPFAMPIIRAQDEVFESGEGIHFLMRDREARKNIPCVITREALAVRGSTYDPPLGPMQVFETYRGEIERVANECWERGEIDRRGIVRVTSSQFG